MTSYESLKSINDLLVNQDGVVIFAGAGCSMAPPSSLPGWNDLNDAILSVLWDRLEKYGLRNEYREIILNAIKRKREENSFPPDYQAQHMVERAGIKYFQLLSAVDSDTYNAVQYYSAILAKEGLIKAVVTTNFDRNFERAFSEFNVPFQSYFDEEGFNKLSAGEYTSAVPLIKIHGCSSSPSSMVDTRKQRLKGRAAALENSLLQLLQQHLFVFAGFSGQDLDDNKNYLGLRDAAPVAKGFTYLYLPGSTVRESMKGLIRFYGENKARSLACDPAQYLEQLVQASGISFNSFTAVDKHNVSLKDRLKIKVASIEPLDAINMLTSLAESYGDEISARYLYDKVWRNRHQSDYEGDALSRFLLNHGRSYVFNFEDADERALSAGTHIERFAIGQEAEVPEVLTNPAKTNLKHAKNVSPETAALIALAQTYLANPILFADFPQSLAGSFQSKPDKTETADITYYYSFYAAIYGDVESLEYLNFAIKEMQDDFDEPRLAQLLSRRAIIKLRVNHPDVVISAEEDAHTARALAEKYHEPNLLALSALALAHVARLKQDFSNAVTYVSESEQYYVQLRRLPQYIESVLEHLKIIMLGFATDSDDKEKLLKTVTDLKTNVEGYIVDRINVFEPEYCYLMGMIMYHYVDIPRDEALGWFVDAISLAKHFNQIKNYDFFIETCRQLNVLVEVERMIDARDRT